jgi:hypothetical protein
MLMSVARKALLSRVGTHADAKINRAAENLDQPLEFVFLYDDEVEFPIPGEGEQLLRAGGEIIHVFSCLHLVFC